MSRRCCTLTPSPKGKGEHEATDRHIDRLVFELYGLTDAEIKIVEEGTAT